MKNRQALQIVDICLSPVVYVAAQVLRNVRRIQVRNLPRCKATLLDVGIYPIQNYYDEPLIDHRLLRHPLNQERDLPGLDWNVEGQLQLLQSFTYTEEIKEKLLSKDSEPVFHFNNRFFEAGDAEFLYNMIRLKKPARIFEIGSGMSTIVAMKAIKENQREDPAYTCKHLCVEPYRSAWLEDAGVIVIRDRVETLDRSLFAELASNDLLFIDSSHIIRPQGDVLYEYLELLPSLQKGVIVHTHDIFSPRDYPQAWVVERMRFWNEQYLLEAFLSCNSSWKIIGGLAYLHLHHFALLQQKCPYVSPTGTVGSFYIQKVS